MTSETRLLMIINNAAAKARHAWPIVLQHLDAAGLSFDFYETTRPGDATIRTRKALRDGVKTVAAIGGDGTLSEAAEGFFEFNKRLEEVPRQINPRRGWRFFRPAPATTSLAARWAGESRSKSGSTF